MSVEVIASVELIATTVAESFAPQHNRSQTRP
jgi:hypothetical protein